MHVPLKLNTKKLNNEIKRVKTIIDAFQAKQNRQRKVISDLSIVPAYGELSKEEMISMIKWNIANGVVIYQSLSKANLFYGITLEDLKG